MSEAMQNKIMQELSNFKTLEKEIHKIIATRQQLDSQLTENKIVIEELNLLKDEAQVYKSVGPILIKTDLIEAKQNITKRMDYISKEIKRLEDQIEDLEKKRDVQQETFRKLQHQFQQAQIKP